jgi:type VI protein secretion system component Hcp
MALKLFRRHERRCSKGYLKEDRIHEKTINGDSSLDDAIVAVDEQRVIRTNFNRDVVLDLSSPELDSSICSGRLQPTTRLVR